MSDKAISAIRSRRPFGAIVVAVFFQNLSIEPINQARSEYKINVYVRSKICYVFSLLLQRWDEADFFYLQNKRPPKNVCETESWAPPMPILANPILPHGPQGVSFSRQRILSPKVFLMTFNRAPMCCVYGEFSGNLATTQYTTSWTPETSR